MSKLEKLTKEHEDLIPVIRQQWLDKLFKCDTIIDRPKATELIHWLYEFSKLEKPVVIFVDSPLACQYAVHFLKAILNNSTDQVRDQVGDQVWAQVGDQVRDQVWAQVGDQVRAQVWDQVSDQVGDQVRDQVWAQVGDQVRDQVGDQVSDQVGYQVRDQVWDEKLEVISFSDYGNIWDYGWLSFFHYFKSIGIKVEHDGFDKFSSLIQCGIYDMIQLKGFCIVSELPTEIYRDENNRLHSIESSSIKWSDGYEQYYVHGRAISQKYFDSIKNKKYSLQDFFNERNEEVKSACIQLMTELYGDNYVSNFFTECLKEVDTYVHKKDEKYLDGTTKGMNIGVYTLFCGDLNGYQIAYVRCYCPSTDRMFYLGVEPKYKKAKDAIASLYVIPSKLKTHIKSIRRQGERFSTSLSEEGKLLIEKMSHSEFENLSTISGDEYFSKMEYEF
jgi:hypothetical protein